jgi:hypothetical protein
MDTLIYASSVVAMGGAIRAFDGRILNGMAFLPDEQYRLLLGWILGILYLFLSWQYVELIQAIDAPTIGISTAWIGHSWWLIERHLKSTDAQEHIYTWMGNHLLMSGVFFLLLWLERLFAQGPSFLG